MSIGRRSEGSWAPAGVGLKVLHSQKTLMMGLDTSVKDGGRQVIEALRSFLEASAGFADTEARARSLVSPGLSESAGPALPARSSWRLTTAGQRELSERTDL